MEIGQLRYFLALSQELSFTRAAARANVAQPALSRQIRKLEDELGTVLVDRTSRHVQMTAAGRRLAEHATRILDEVENARADMQQVAELATGQLTVGATQTPGPLNIARLLHDFHVMYPGIELAVREGMSVDIADRLRADELDLAFVSALEGPARDGLRMQLIASEPLVVVLPTNHRFAGAVTVDFSELRDAPFISFPVPATIRSTLDRLARSLDVRPNIAFVTSDKARMRELVSLGLGVTLLPRSDATQPGLDLAIAAVSNESLSYDVYLASRSSRRQSHAAVAMSKLVLSP